MESELLDTPDGILARLVWDPKTDAQTRRRALVRELVAERVGASPADVTLDHDEPTVLGSHPRPRARIGNEDVPLTIATATYGPATVVAVCDPSVTIGLDVRDMHPDESAVREIRRHSHLLEETDLAGLLRHWTRVQAVLEADMRPVRVHPENVRLDLLLNKAWVAATHTEYRIVDLSRDGWIVTLAHRASDS